MHTHKEWKFLNTGCLLLNYTEKKFYAVKKPPELAKKVS